MNFQHTLTSGVKIYGFEFVPFQQWSPNYRRRLVIDFSEHSFAIQWKKVK